MTDKKTEETEVATIEETSVVEETSEDTQAKTEKSPMKIPFAAVMVLGFGLTLAVIITVFGDKSGNLSAMYQQMTAQEQTESTDIADMSATEQMNSDDIPVIDAPVASVPQVEAVAPASESVSRDTTETTDNVVASVAPQVKPQVLPQAPTYAQYQQQRMRAIEASMEKQRQMMADMFEMRKTVFMQAEKRRQQALEKMQEMQAKMEQRQMEMLKKQQQAFRQAMQKS